MKNFYLLRSQAFISPLKLLDALSLNLKLKDEASKPQELQKLGQRIQVLWKAFNKDRKELKSDYMSNPEYIKAYLASFLTPNIERTFSILSQGNLKQSLLSLLKGDDPHKPLRILDFGAGPLSSTLGLLCALEAALKNEDFHFKREIIIDAVDTGSLALEKGREFLKAASVPRLKYKLQTASSLNDLEKASYDFILASNVFNEIPRKNRDPIVKNLLASLGEGGLFLIVEPGQQEHSYDLASLRNQIVSSQENISLLGPCLHYQKCPLSKDEGRKDWCWFRHLWNPPKLQNEIDRLTKLDHRELSYSYLLLKKAKRVPSTLFARVVSDSIPYRNKSRQTLYKALLCAEDGTLKALHLEDQEKDKVKRGETLKSSFFKKEKS
jgi:ribosomal protein RSM22 (predicted rRNA methylase)